MKLNDCYLRESILLMFKKLTTCEKLESNSPTGLDVLLVGIYNWINIHQLWEVTTTCYVFFHSSSFRQNQHCVPNLLSDSESYSHN